MKKIIMSFFTLMVCFLVLDDKKMVVSAEEIINLNDYSYTVVSEEHVILDYMRATGVNRQIAINKLGLEVSTFATAAASSSCYHQWREYRIDKTLIDSWSKSYLTTYPYIKMKQCGNSRAEITDISPQVSYVRSGSIRINDIVVNSIVAQKESKHVARVRANGSIKNVFGVQLRDWKYSKTFTFM